MARTNQHKPLPPKDELHKWVRYYWHLGLKEEKIIEHVLRRCGSTKYGLSIRSLSRVRATLGLKGTRQRSASFDDIAPLVQEIRDRFPTMGARQMVTVLLQDYSMKVSETLLLEYFRESEPDAVKARKKQGFRRKRFWAAGVMDIWSIDQHDKWKRFGLWLHLSVDPYPGRVAWLKIWWCNRNTRLINSYYLGAGRRDGGVPLVTQSDRGKENNGVANMHTALRHRLDPSLRDTLQHRWCIDKSNIKAEALWSQLRRQFTPGFENILDKGVNEGLYNPTNALQNLVFRWLAIPWLQAELDAWASRYNTSTRRADKHKLLPRGIPDLIHENPEDYNTKNFMVVVTPEIFDELEAKYAPRDDPVFRLVPPTFQQQVSVLYTTLGSPPVSSVSFWTVYSNLLAAFQPVIQDADLANALLAANEGEEFETPLVTGLRDLRHGVDVIGPFGNRYTYLGGLENPDLEAPDEDEDGDVDLREYGDFSD